MLTYLELLLIMFILFVVAVFVFKKNLSSPAVLAMGAYFIMSLLAILGLESWNSITQLSQKTIGLISASAGSFLIGCIVASAIKVPCNKRNFELSEKMTRIFKNKNPKMGAIMASILLLYAILSVINIRGTCAMLGVHGLNFAEMLSTYNGNTGIFAKEQVVFSKTLSFIIPKLLIIIDAMFCILAMKTAVRKRYKIKTSLIEKILLIISLLFSFLTGSRSHFIKLVLIYFSIHYLLRHMLNKQKSANITINSIIKTILIITSAICVFYGSISFIGRQTKMDISSYISFYYGVQVPSLDIYLNKNIAEQSYKSRTFDSIKGIQKKIGIIEDTEKTSFEFIQYGKYGGSNIYTSARRPYDDFGLIGLIFLMMLFGAFSTRIFKKALVSNGFSLLIFYHIAILDTIIDQVRDLSFYARVISSGIIVYCLVCIIIPKLYIRTIKHGKA